MTKVIVLLRNHIVFCRKTEENPIFLLREINRKTKAIKTERQSGPIWDREREGEHCVGTLV